MLRKILLILTLVVVLITTLFAMNSPPALLLVPPVVAGAALAAGTMCKKCTMTESEAMTLKDERRCSSAFIKLIVDVSSTVTSVIKIPIYIYSVLENYSTAFMTGSLFLTKRLNC